MDEEQLIRRLEKNPVDFIELILDRKLSIKQKEFLDATKIHKHVVAIWSRQTGKSTVIAAYIVWRLLYGKGTKEINEQIAIVAPIKEQLTNLYDKMKSFIDKSEIISSYIIKINSERIVMKNGNKANFFSGSPGSHIRGYTATCIVIDESQDITDHKYSADILPFGATTNALIIEAGTPKTKNHFFEVVNSREVKVIKQPWFDCPFLSEDYVMSQRNITPESLWRQEYLCEFIEDGVLAFPSWLFEPKGDNWNLGDYECISDIASIKAEVLDPEATYTAGLDLGKQKDNSVYVIYRTDVRPIRLAVKIKFSLQTPYKEIAKQVAFIHRLYSPYEFNVDYSNEKGFIEMLQENEVAVMIDKKNKRGAIAFGNKNKAEMISATRILLEQYQLQIPKSDEELISEFLNQQYEVTESGMYKYYHPSNQNDDSLWATLLALKNVARIENLGKTVVFTNPWEKHDEKVGADYSNRREVLFANAAKASANRGPRRTRHRF